MSNLPRTPPRTAQPVANNTTSNSLKRRAEEQGWECDEKLSLESAVKMLITEFRQTNSKIDMLNGKLDDVKSELATVSNDIQTLKEDCAEKFRAADAALHTTSKQVYQLHQTVDNMENRSELTIRGIPFMKDENLYAIFKAICKQLTVREPSTHIRRVKARNQTGSNEGLIVVEFSLKNDRDDFYSAYLRKRDLKLKHVGLDSDHRIYVNENLTIAARKLKVLALDLKRAGKLASVFTKHGIVHVKKSTDDSSVAIHEEEDLKFFS